MRSLLLTLCTALLFLYTAKAQTAMPSTGYPAKAEDISPLLIGEKFPPLTLPDAAGKNIALEQLFSAKPTILIFYRGGWCPYCNRQLSGLQEIEQELTGLGYQVVAVSTDIPERLKASIDKEKLSYQLLSDADLSLAKSVGIAFNAPEAYHKFLPETTGRKNTDLLLPVPSVFILDRSSRIRFEYIAPDYKERMSADLLKAAAAALYKSL